MPICEMLSRAFHPLHPGFAAMKDWLSEEGISTVAQLQATASAGNRTVALYLRELGFTDAWAAVMAEACESSRRSVE
jgi:hypothetical protein